MALSIILLIVCVLIMVGLATLIYLRNKDLPPGPYGLPLVGFLPFLGKNPIATMTNLKEKYGSVVSISLGQRSVVILNDWQAVKEALIKQGATFSGRVPIPLSKRLFNEKDILFMDGSIWKEQRQFSLHILRDFGLGRTSMESRIMYEVDKLADYLSENAGKPIEITKLFFLHVINIIWNILAGKRFEESDEFILTFKKLLHGSSSRTASYNMMNSLPFLQHISLLLKWNKKMSEKVDEEIKMLHLYMQRELNNHETDFQENNLTDFIDVYLSEILNREKKNGKTVPPYDREHLRDTILDLFIAGGETVDSTMCWALLHMAYQPNIQRKVQEELDRVVAKDSYLSMSSKALAPYTEATLLEIQRHPTLVPLSVPHRVTNDTTLLGYKIPRDTMVYPNIFAVHHDIQYWGDPDTFRPERFLDETGNNVIRHECFMPFSVGPRSCMGDTLARMELHLLFTTLLRRFTFETVPGKEPSMEPIPGVTFAAQPFSLIVKSR